MFQVWLLIRDAVLRRGALSTSEDTNHDWAGCEGTPWGSSICGLNNQKASLSVCLAILPFEVFLLFAAPAILVLFAALSSSGLSVELSVVTSTYG